MSAFGGRADIQSSALHDPLRAQWDKRRLVKGDTSRDAMTDITLINEGVRLAASVYGPADAQPILFLHGISLSRDTWLETVQRFAATHGVWTLDFRGHGHSDKAGSYQLEDYQSDAEIVLAAIERPAIVVGHSLGGLVAGSLAQSTHPKVRAVVLVDPPWYLGHRETWEQSVFPKLFALISAQQAALQRQNAPLAEYVAFLANAPSPMGGVARDHLSSRHILSHASAIQRQDNRCWEDVFAVTAALSADRPLPQPTKLIQADPQCGAALLEGHEVRFSSANPEAEIVRYQRCGHSPHRYLAFEQRFWDDLQAFIAKIELD
jgi:pimeloyl-ACP methyl ester carboxylesterase